MLEPLEKIAKQASKLDINKLLQEVFSDKSLQQLILNLNKDQLNQGETPEGDVIGFYRSLSYSLFKDSLANYEASFGVVNLKVTGEFYDSLTFTNGKTEFTINADPIREDTNLFEKYGEDRILGINEENINIILQQVSKRLKRIIIQTLSN